MVQAALLPVLAGVDVERGRADARAGVVITWE